MESYVDLIALFLLLFILHILHMKTTFSSWPILKWVGFDPPTKIPLQLVQQKETKNWSHQNVHEWLVTQVSFCTHSAQHYGLFHNHTGLNNTKSSFCGVRSRTLENIHAIHPTSEDSYSDLRLWSLLVSLYPSVYFCKEESSLLWWKNKTHG